MLGLWLGFVGFSIATGCVVKSDDDDGADDGAAGEDPGGGGSGNRGGSGGNTGGSSGNTGGSGGNTGGTGGATGGTGGMTGGTSGTGGDDFESDTDEGELVNTPYPDCEPRDADDDCEVCIEANCCAESRVCFGFNPGNVCGAGGPGPESPYAGNSEFDCYRFCAEDGVMENGVYDEDVQNACLAECVTPACDGVVVGNATQDIIVCMDANCEDECYTPE
jgi:hypothetical protein